MSMLPKHGVTYLLNNARIQIRLFRKRLREDESTVAETVPTNPPDPIGSSPPFEIYGGETNESDQNTIKSTVSI